MIGIPIALAVLLLGWLLYISTRPLPGQKQTMSCDNFTDFSKLVGANTEDKCRVHVPDGTEVHYASNPPTIGPHYSIWTNPGIYDEPKDDRNLIHSLEHGYVIMSYRCNLPPASGDATASAQASPSGKLDSKSDCDDRKNKLVAIYNDKDKRKLIVLPRPNLDTNFALTAWDYLDKFDDFDKSRVTKFIDSHRDQGPEHTME